MKYIFILNGKAGDGKSKDKLLNQLNKLQARIEYEVYETKAQKDATNYILDYCAKNKKEQTCFVACGGDGTINEVASAIVNEPNKCFAILAYGSGNDFIKYYKDKSFLDLQKLIEGTVAPIDIMKVNDKYSVNVCNFGFDAIVGSVANKVKEKGGKDPYGTGVKTAIFKGRFNKINVVADGEQISRKRMLLCTLSNNCYVGGQFYCAPKAKNNDGLIDLCLVHTMPLLGFLMLLKPYTNGEHLDSPKFKNKLVYKQVKHVEVTSEKEIELCLDGEMLPGTHFEIDIIPGAVNFVIPRD